MRWRMPTRCSRSCQMNTSPPCSLASRSCNSTTVVRELPCMQCRWHVEGVGLVRRDRPVIVGGEIYDGAKLLLHGVQHTLQRLPKVGDRNNESVSFGHRGRTLGCVDCVWHRWLEGHCRILAQTSAFDLGVTIVVRSGPGTRRRSTSCAPRRQVRGGGVTAADERGPTRTRSGVIRERSRSRSTYRFKSFRAASMSPSSTRTSVGPAIAKPPP
jgi:hypothetical protein